MPREVELLWKGNNRSAIRAMDEIANRSTRMQRRLGQDSKRSAASMDHLGRSTGRLRSAASGLAGTVGLGGLAFGLADVFRGGVQLQNQQSQLQTALRSTGQAAGGTYEQLKAAAESLSTKGGFATTENLSALTAFVRETRSATKAQSMLSLATNIARGTGTGLAQAQQVVARAYTGQVGRLQKLLGPMIASKEAAFGLSQAHKQEILQLTAQSKALGKAGPLWLKQQEIMRGITPQQAALAALTDKHATATEFLAKAQQVFGTATATYAKTSAGRLSNMRNSIKNLVDALGVGLLPIMNKVISVVAKVVSWLGKHRIVLYGLLAAVAAVSAILLAHAAVMATVEAKNIVLAATNRLLGTSFGVAAVGEEGATAATFSLGAAMDALPILALITGIVLVVTHFKQAGQIVSTVFNAVKQAATSAFNWIKTAFGHVFQVLSYPFRQAWSFISGVFGTLKGGFTSVVGWIAGAWAKVRDILTWPFRMGWKAIKWVLNKIIDGINFVIGKWNDTVGSIPIVGSFVSVGKIHHLYSGGVVPGGPSGPDTVPAWLTPGEGVLTTRAMAMLGSQGLNAMNQGRTPREHITIEPGQVIVRVDSRTLAEAVVRYTLRRAARGPSTLSGGSLATGAVSVAR